MRAVFTLCSVNYLAHAKSLAESISVHHPDLLFFVGLVDKLQGRDPLGLNIVEIEQLKIEGLDQMISQYNIIELNTAVKPWMFSYIFSTYTEVKDIVYLDPDILVFNSLDSIFSEMENADLLLTPHSNSPYPDNYQPDDQRLLIFGEYNLGFCAFRRSENAFLILDWWKKKLSSDCKIELNTGLFVDQKWMNLAPVYFKKVGIFRHPGANVAYWNLHERKISSSEAGKFLSSGSPLIFFHFSSYSLKNPEVLTRYSSTIGFDVYPEVKQLYSIYRNALLKNGFEHLHKEICYYSVIRQERIKAEKQMSKRFSGKIFDVMVKVIPKTFREKLGYALIASNDNRI